MRFRNTIFILIGICCVGAGASFINRIFENPQEILQYYGVPIHIFLVFVLIFILIKALITRLSMALVNKFMLNEATAINCAFWKILVAIGASITIAVLPIPLVNLVLSIFVLYYLLMTFTNGPLIELIIIVVLSNILIWLLIELPIDFLLEMK